MLPIVQRELQVAARSRRLYAWRMRAGLIMILLAAGVILTGSGDRQATAGGLFRLFCFVAVAFCLLEGVRNAADSLSEEKREGTLGLLFLTDLSGIDVVLGKLATSMVRSFNTLLSFLPILAITLLLGGTTGGEFWRMVLVLIVTLFISLSACLLVSALSRQKSVGAALLLLFFLSVLPLGLGAVAGPLMKPWVLSASPFYLLNTGSDAYFPRDPGPFWAGTGWLFAVSILSLVLAGLILPHAWQDKPRKASAQSRPSGPVSRRELRKRGELLDRNPAMWLMSDPRRRRTFHWFIGFLGFCAVAGTLFFFVALPYSGIEVPGEAHLVVVGLACAGIMLSSHFFVARECSFNLAEARQNGALELILSTPMRVNEITRGQLLSVGTALIPAGIMLALFAGYLSFFVVIMQGASTVLIILQLVAQSVLGALAIAWLGMWMALTSKTPARAFFKTVTYGVIGPYLLVCIPTLATQLVLFLLARDKVKANFRRFVAERYLQQDFFTMSPVTAAPRESPPVLR